MPMKVRDAERAGRSGQAERPGRRLQDNSSGFLDVAKQTEDKHVVDRLRKMADEIAIAGEKLADRIDIRELNIYRKLIAGFMEEAVGNSRRFSKQSFLDRRGRHKVYAVIKRINIELDELTKDMLSSERDRLVILKRIDDIRGMILDIVM